LIHLNWKHGRITAKVKCQDKNALVLNTLAERVNVEMEIVSGENSRSAHMLRVSNLLVESLLLNHGTMSNSLSESLMETETL
jgi:hypothetical protein